MEYFGQQSSRLLETQLEQENIHDVFLKKCSFPEKVLRQKAWKNSILDECYVDQSIFNQSEFNKITIKMSNVREANFTESLFDDVTFENNILIKSIFSQCHLRSVKISECVAPSSVFTNAVIENCHFRNIDWTKANLSNSVFYSSIFEFPGTFGVTGIRDGRLNRSFFFDCEFQGEVFENCSLDESVFVKCRFKQVSWNDIDTSKAVFAECLGGPHGANDRQQIHLTETDFLKLFNGSSLL